MKVEACDECKVLSTQRPLYEVQVHDDSYDFEKHLKNPNPKIYGVSFLKDPPNTCLLAKKMCALCARNFINNILNGLTEEEQRWQGKTSQTMIKDREPL